MHNALAVCGRGGIRVAAEAASLRHWTTTTAEVAAKAALHRQLQPRET
jgi:hypothetical protein